MNHSNHCLGTVKELDHYRKLLAINFVYHKATFTSGVVKKEEHALHLCYYYYE